MKIKSGKEEAWEEIQEVNKKNFYSNACVTYAERWADLMEERFAEGFTIQSCADETSDEADIDGITGFQYSAARNILINVWEYGEKLGIWHCEHRNF